MITLDKVIIMDISKDDILNAVERARQLSFQDNLRNRKPTVQFDCKVRGFLGEIGITKWLNSFGVKCWPEEKDGISAMDIYRSDIDLNIRGMQKDYLSEIKTSAKPDSWTTVDISTDKVFISKCIINGDIKIIAHKNADYHTDIDRDIYIQVYFGVKTAEHDNMLNERYSENRDFLLMNNNDICHFLGLYDYIENIYFVGWKDKKSIIEELDNMKPYERSYDIGAMRSFWKCSLKTARPPISLINYLRT